MYYRYIRYYNFKTGKSAMCMVQREWKRDHRTTAVFEDIRFKTGWNMYIRHVVGSSKNFTTFTTFFLGITTVRTTMCCCICFHLS